MDHQGALCLVIGFPGDDDAWRVGQRLDAEAFPKPPHDHRSPEGELAKQLEVGGELPWQLPARPITPLRAAATTKVVRMARPPPGRRCEGGGDSRSARNPRSGNRRHRSPGGQRSGAARAGDARELGVGLVEMVEVEVGVAQRVNEIARFEPRHLGNQVRQQRIGGDVEGTPRKISPERW